MVLPAIISGGFFVAAPSEPEKWMPDLLPERIVSVDSSLAEVVPSEWGHQKVAPSRRDGLVSLGEPADQWLDAALANGTLVLPDILASPEACRELISVAGLSPEAFWVLGLGLPSARLERFDPLEDHGVDHFLRARSPLPDGGEALGFEISAYVNCSIGESWLHDGLQRDAAERFAWRPNSYGLIDTLEEAERIVAWVNEEPDSCYPEDTWEPWLIVRYASS